MPDELDDTRRGHIGPKVEPAWWDFVRQVVMFAVAIGLVVASIVTPGHDVPWLVAALVLFGIVPVERIVAARVERAAVRDDAAPAP